MRLALLLLLTAVAACGDANAGAEAAADAGANADATANANPDADAVPDAHAVADADAVADAGAVPDAAPPCTTRITYGRSWIHGANHPASFDDAPDLVTWDGTCTNDGANSYATLSNGWKPYFGGNDACVMALDASHCAGAGASCATRIAYGATWKAAPNHPNAYDDVADRVLWDGLCASAPGDSVATLSNGWTPHFASSSCALSIRYTQCGGLYANPVVPVDCPDPGVLHDGARYVMACTSGNAADAFPLRTSSDLVTWTDAGHVFPSAAKPAWAKSDFWAPEIHKVGARYVAYFTARHTDGQLSIGAATASDPLGPFTDVGAPLVHEASMGVIDPTEFEAPNGDRYLIWKDDGNAASKPTPIHARAIAADGVTFTGPDTVLITNDQSWEGALVEGPWMIAHAGEFFLFYSANSYASTAYAIGVARASSPLGPFTKPGGPLITTKGAWAGPGHCSVVDAPSGDLAVVYHAWVSGHVAGPGDGRELLVDRVAWGSDGWPTTIAPSTGSVTMP